MSALGPPRASDPHRAVLVWTFGLLALVIVGHWVYRARLHEQGRIAHQAQEARRIARKQQVVSVTAQQLLDAYQGNIPAANERYLGRTLRIHGVVNSVERNAGGGEILGLKVRPVDHNVDRGPYCLAKPDSILAHQTLGRKVEIEGAVCEDENMQFVTLDIERYRLLPGGGWRTPGVIWGRHSPAGH